MCWTTRGLETQRLDQNARRGADGSFVQLEHGYTHYQVAGEEGQRPIVLVHGFSVPSFIWEPTFLALAGAGKHVIRYDLYGRGFSDRPDVSYNLHLFVEQLLQLLDALGHREADLMGLSMGGPIVSAFTAAFPERVRKLVLIDPSGARPIHLGILYRLATLPGIGDIIFDMFGTDYMLDRIAADFFEPASINEFRERYRVQMRFQGFQRAIRSTVRNNMLGSFIDTYTRLGQLGTPVLLVWGECDTTVPFAQSRLLRKLLPKAEFLPVPDCGHIPHYERPDIVQPRLIDYLN